ncbi:MAG: MarP family serine protease [Thermoleophilia bacterium]|nr:MarP family serine protease [Thermoleophilia bacterium]
MSAVDLIALALIALIALGGFRRGLVVGVFSFGGLLLGFYVSSRIGPFLFGGGARWVPLFGIGLALVCAAVGRTIGAIAGRSIRGTLLVFGPLRLLDSVGGGLLGAALGIALCWVVGVIILYLPADVGLSRYARESTIISTLNTEVPPTRLLGALDAEDLADKLIGPELVKGEPDPKVLDSRRVSAASLSVVRVIGEACGRRIEGSGWVAGRRLVVTNAHVVAGIDVPRVDRNDGNLLEARVVSFDRKNDIAVLRVPGLTARPLPLADAVEGTSGGMLGYPGNGPYTETAVRVGGIASAIDRDIYGKFPTLRRVTTVRGRVRSGNSGGPVVDARGRVITTVFAQRAGGDGGYGVPTSLVRAAIARAGTKALETACVGG